MRTSPGRADTVDVSELVAREAVDSLSVTVYATPAGLGAAAASEVAARLRHLLSAQANVRIAFAAAPSQDAFLEALAMAAGVDWSRVHAFQLDEYAGAPRGAPWSFASYLARRILDAVRPGRVELFDGEREAEAERRRYSELVTEKPLDVACLGIGENGHLAFNDPPLADFDDPLPVRVVALSPSSRRQQVADGCFADLADVPEQALTLTIPTLMSSRYVHCVVPGRRKLHAVERALRGPIEAACPASVLRRHPAACLYLDRESYPGCRPGR